MSTPGWFGDLPGRDEAEAAFLARLRREAASWSVDGLSASGTSSVYIGWPLYAEVEVPALAALPATLQIEYWTTGSWAERSGGTVLHGAWGDDYLLEHHDGNDPECLTVVGVDAAPEQHATWAAAWLLRQLRRPVVRQDWSRGDRLVASTWRLADTGTVLRRQGIGWRRLRRRPPDQVTQVR